MLHYPDVCSLRFGLNQHDYASRNNTKVLFVYVVYFFCWDPGRVWQKIEIRRPSTSRVARLKIYFKMDITGSRLFSCWFSESAGQNTLKKWYAVKLGDKMCKLTHPSAYTCFWYLGVHIINSAIIGQDNVCTKLRYWIIHTHTTRLSRHTRYPDLSPFSPVNASKKIDYRTRVCIGV